MPLTSQTHQRIEQAEGHFLNGLQRLKTMRDTTTDMALSKQLQGIIDELELSETPYDEVMRYVRTVNKKAVDNAPQFIAHRVVELGKDDRGLERSIVRMNTSRIDQTRQNSHAFFRRQPVKIFNPLTGQFIIRMPMGGGGLKGLSKDSIALDYDAMDTLGIRSKFSDGMMDAELVVSRAGTWSIARYFWNHPEFGYRLSMRLGFIGLVLGIIGFIPMVFGAA